MRSGNPALSENVFRNASLAETAGQSMTLEGTVVKTGLLLAVLVAAAGFVWSQAPAVSGYMIAGLIGGLVLAVITIFKPSAAPYTAPIYAAFEGLAMGGISVVYNAQFHGIVFQAVGLTFGTLAAMLLAYGVGLVKATERFKSGVIAATGGICLVYLATMILSLFHVSVPYIHGNGMVGIGFSLFVVVIAALNLVLDFDFIERGVEQSAPKYMEWYGGFSLLVTLVWLYLEILRLLAKASSRD